MNKKVLYILIAIVFIISLFGITDRLTVEKNNNYVELTFDYNSILEMSKEYNGQTLTISDLKSYGINSIALTPISIDKLIERGKVVFFDSEEINKNILLSKEDNLLRKFSDLDQGALLIFKEADNFYNNLKVIQDDLNLQFEEIEGRHIVVFPFWDKDYFSIDLGINQQLLNEIKNNNLDVVYRFSNQKINDINYKLLSELSTDSPIIFSGQEILGYPDKIDKTADLMKKNNIIFGYIEAIIGVQKGEDTLAEKLDYNITRVHSITQNEMNIYSESKIVNRYKRAVRERNIRHFYLRPIIKEDMDFQEVKQLNESYLSRLKTELESSGYITNRARPYQKFSNDSKYLILSALGILLGGVLLLIELFNVKKALLQYVFIVLGIIGILLIFNLFNTYFYRAILALGSSIVFPSLAIITQLMKKDNKKNILSYIKAALITLIGAGFVVVSLADIGYLTKVYQFRGVKLAFLMPLIIITFYYFMEYIVREKETTLKKKLLEILDINLKIKHIVILALVGLGGVYYILRTGNFPILDIPAIEDKFRILLEEILFVRPRFKEFLIGHPAFIITLFYYKNLKDNFGLYFLSLLAVIGQLNILNSFAHIHTPILISLLRTVHGLWIGLVFGIISVYIISLFNRFFNKQRVS